MVKIVVIEDDEEDIVRRYGSLTSNHDVHLRLEGLLGSDFARSSNYLLAHFGKNGFSPENIQRADINAPIEQADVYFLDGLRGRCFSWLENLPRNRTFIYSDSSAVKNVAKERGYADQILKVSPEEAIKRVMESVH